MSYLESILLSWKAEASNGKRKRKPSGENDTENKRPTAASASQRAPRTAPSDRDRSLAVPRPTIESLRWNYNQRRRAVSPGEAFAKWLTVYGEISPCDTNLRKQQFDAINAKQILNFLHCDVSPMLEMGAVDAICADNREQFVYGTQFLLRSSILSRLPLQDQVMLLQKTNSSYYAWILARRSLDKQKSQNGHLVERDCLVLPNKSTLQLQSACVPAASAVGVPLESDEMSRLRTKLSFIITDILAPLHSLELDDFEMNALLTLHLYRAASFLRLSRQEDSDLVQNSIHRLVTAIEVYLEDLGAHGRCGELFLLSNVFTSLEARLHYAFEADSGLRKALIPVDFIEQVLLLDRQ